MVLKAHSQAADTLVIILIFQVGLNNNPHHQHHPIFNKAKYLSRYPRAAA
jgi:hypothetical protein